MNCRRLIAPLVVLLFLSWLPDAAAGKGSANRRARNPVKASARRASTREARRTTRQGQRPGDRSAATPEGRLRDELAGIWAGRILRRGVTAVFVVDARTGEDIYSVHPDDQINPASNVKLVSTATVLDLMGPEWRYLTRLFGPAPDAKGVARGDLYLRGNADPTLTGAGLDEVAKSAARAGLKRVEGSVLLSDDLLRDTVSAPRIQIRVRAAERPGAPPVVTTDPSDTFVQVHVTATTTTSRRARLEVTAQPLADPPAGEAGASPAPTGWDGPRILVTVAGTIRKGRSGTYLRSLGMRSTFTGYALRQALRAAGVEVTGGVRLIDFETYSREAVTAGFLPIELGRHRSRAMQELVARVNKRSLNSLADRLIMTAGAEAAGGGAPSMENGIEAMYRWLEQSGLDRKEIVVDTGSGLSHRTKLTVRHLVRILRAASGYIGQAPVVEPASYLASLAVGGVDGTLRGRFRSDALRGRVVGKTGTLHNSIALSGFVSDDTGNAICFAIVTNGNRWDARYRIRREHEQMVAAMKRYLDARTASDETRRAAETAAPDAAPEATKDAPGDADEDGEAGDVSEASEPSEAGDTATPADGDKGSSKAAPEPTRARSPARPDAMPAAR